MTEQKFDKEKEAKKIINNFKRYIRWAKDTPTITEIRKSQDYIHARVLINDHIIFKEDIPDIVQSIKSVGYLKTELSIVYARKEA